MNKGKFALKQKKAKTKITNELFLFNLNPKRV